ncbi:MAG: hypothetical protein AAGJ34_03750 [Pseudomonadota bacterium]
MLPTIALCTILFDLNGLWISYLPVEMQDAYIEEHGLDIWSEDVANKMAESMGSASGGDRVAALTALLEAERKYFTLTPEEVLAETKNCAEGFSTL